MWNLSFWDFTEAEIKEDILGGVGGRLESFCMWWPIRHAAWASSGSARFAAPRLPPLPFVGRVRCRAWRGRAGAAVGPSAGRRSSGGLSSLAASDWLESHG